MTVIAAHPLHPKSLSRSATHSMNRVQITLPPGPIRVGLETVY